MIRSSKITHKEMRQTKKKKKKEKLQLQLLVRAWDTWVVLFGIIVDGRVKRRQPVDPESRWSHSGPEWRQVESSGNDD